MSLIKAAFLYTLLFAWPLAAPMLLALTTGSLLPGLDAEQRDGIILFVAYTVGTQGVLTACVLRNPFFRK